MTGSVYALTNRYRRFCRRRADRERRNMASFTGSRKLFARTDSESTVKEKTARKAGEDQRAVDGQHCNYHASGAMSEDGALECHETPPASPSSTTTDSEFIGSPRSEDACDRSVFDCCPKNPEKEAESIAEPSTVDEDASKNNRVAHSTTIESVIKDNSISISTKDEKTNTSNHLRTPTAGYDSLEEVKSKITVISLFRCRVGALLKETANTAQGIFSIAPEDQIVFDKLKDSMLNLQSIVNDFFDVMPNICETEMLHECEWIGLMARNMVAQSKRLKRKGNGGSNWTSNSSSCGGSLEVEGSSYAP